jgi:hypothetical protein
MSSRLAAAIALLALLVACADTRAGKRLRILFVGNSLTMANDLPEMVENIAKANGERIECLSVAFSGYSLEDHWSQGDAARAIAAGSWTFVVLQQGPSALPESRVHLRADVRRFDEVITRHGARTALYMVWPSSERRQDFDAVSESYALAAADVRGILLPAGDAWRAAWREDPSLPLYGSDGFHPSPLGSYLAALVIYNRLIGPASPGAAPGLPRLPAGHVAILQRAVASVAAVPSRR